ncbi:MAG: GNAT family N-acetyltransferase, partial [Haliscomenobacter sp.]|nr:GNAT family N-acetyltransferase [Haliscomenobacter sp.]
IVPYAFAHLDITRLFARPFHTNIGSQRALEKAGFKLEARLAQTLFKHGVYYDELIYSILRER